MTDTRSWESTLVAPDVSLEDAIGVMDRSGLRIAIIVDDDRRLLGTLTDGDVRRALIKHQSLQSHVSEVMCAAPRVAKREWARERTLTAMETADLLQLPVVDDDRRVVGLETLHGLLGSRLLNNPVFVMAGGFGTRLHPLTQNCPKPMLKVGDKPILELILESLIEKGFHRFFFSTHFMPELIQEYFQDGRRWGVSIHYVHEPEPLGTGGALGLLPHDEVDSPLLMINGDLLTTLDYRGLLDFHAQNGGSATVCVGRYEHHVPYGVIESDGPFVISMIEKPLHRYFINAGIYVLSPDFVRRVTSDLHADMPDLLTALIASGERVAMFPIHEYWLDIGRPEDFLRAQLEVEGLSSE